MPHGTNESARIILSNDTFRVLKSLAHCCSYMWMIVISNTSYDFSHIPFQKKQNKFEKFADALLLLLKFCSKVVQLGLA